LVQSLFTTTNQLSIGYKWNIEVQRPLCTLRFQLQLCEHWLVVVIGVLSFSTVIERMSCFRWAEYKRGSPVHFPFLTWFYYQNISSPYIAIRYLYYYPL
jgi:hypothetical protein